MKKFLLFILILPCFFLVVSAKAQVVIKDELINSNLRSSISFPPKINNQKIADEFVPNISNKFCLDNKSEIPVFQDELLNSLKNTQIQPISTNLNYDYESIDCVVFPVKITKNISSQNVQAGEKIVFSTTKAVEIKDKIIFPKGTEIFANIEFVSQNEMKGEPAILIIDNFVIKDLPKYKLEGKIYKEGAKRSYWINPISKILTPFWGTGFLFYLIRGGHAKINSNQIYNLYLWQKVNK